MKRAVATMLFAVAALAWLPSAWSQAAYPAKPIHIVVPFVPGGPTDPIARAIGQKLQEAWGQPVVVENKPGAGTIVGTDYVAKAPPDGYTILLAATSFTVNPSAYSKLPYDPAKDLTPITLVLKIPLLLVVNPQVPARSVKELVDYMKQNPGKLNFSSIGNGTTMQLAGELFKSMAGVNMVHVPYKGSGPSVLSVVTGECALTFDSVFLTMPQVKAGKLRALAATTTKPSIFAPELPTVHDSGLPGFDVESWLGFLAPAGTPREVVHKLQREIARILQTPEIRDRLMAQGLEPIGSTTEYFADYIKSETAKWGKVVKQAGIKLD